MARIEIKNRLNLYFLEGERWRVFNIFTKRLFDHDLRLVSLIATVAVTILVTLLDQTSWAAVIHCPATATTVVCRGTSGDDLILGPFSNGGNPTIIRGLGGNDYIEGSFLDKNYLWGDDGNDILVGGDQNDGLYGGRGNDKYDGGNGEDTILEDTSSNGTAGSLVNNDDIISGGEMNDYIQSGEGVDRINGGPGNDVIYPGGLESIHRDFSYDSVDCGSGLNDYVELYSFDPDTATNCENVSDHDG